MSQAPRPVPSVGQTYLMVNDLYTFRATSAETNGGYMLIDAVIPPGGGPPPHIHTRETEVFVVIEGRVTCTENGASRTLGPGETITLLPGRTHTFRNDTDKSARMLVICLPAAIESMFAECGEAVAASYTPGPARPPTREEIGRLVESCARSGISFP
ncbi:MAG: cupin domain-containing protein [Phycisphaerales bacterium]